MTAEKVRRFLAPHVTKEDLLSALFFNAEESPVAFTQPNTVWNFLKYWDVSGIQKKDVEEFYRRRASELQTRRPVRKRFDRHYTWAWGLNDRWQLDLLQKEKKSSGRYGNFAFILTKIDVFSRKVNAKAITSKSGPVVVKAFQEILQEDGVPRYVQTDQGKEFFNEHFARVLRDKGIKHYFVHSDTKAAVVERFNRTLRGVFNAYREYSPKVPFKTALARVIEGFNSRPHSSTGYAPNDITQHNHGFILQDMMKHRDAMAEAAPKPKFSFRVGDRVRVANHPNQFNKEAAGTFSREVYVIQERRVRYPHLNIPIYKLEDLVGRPLEGIHYEAQLQKVLPPLGDKHNPRVIKKDPKTGRKLVKYPEYPNDYQEWI